MTFEDKYVHTERANCSFVFEIQGVKAYST